ncbi:DNA polymerase III beta subunit [Candidatus Hydrogenisulfobacillus filiaventi]|uniref:DNA polymerase III subunit beta n=1 Tax=Candidatus Hydrogenisulfobacillus filiaventi TaxID=2707344 RepID=A0A6F8ZJA2_9FIRM|nr:DNA polymerase III beta subunit [Candidatus Hydrogenisulfobacillus filiaventi]
MHMRITVSRDALAGALDRVTRAVANQLALPLLGGVQLTVDAASLRVIATDLTLWMDASVPVETLDGAGSAVVPAGPLTELVRRIPTDTLTMETSGQQMAIQYGRGRATIHQYEEDALPAPPEDEAIEMVASDSTRMARWHLPGVGGVSGRFVVPSRAMAEIARALAEADDDAEVSVARSDVALMVRTPHLRCVARLLDDQYPPVQGVTSRSTSVTVRLPLEDLRGAAERLVVVTGRGNSQADLVARVEPGLLILSTTASEVGHAAEELEAETEFADGAEIVTASYNPKFWAEAVQALVGEIAEVRLSAVASHPARLATMERPMYTHWLMPLVPLV